jgi:hypothetical protein
MATLCKPKKIKIVIIQSIRGKDAWKFRLDDNEDAIPKNRCAQGFLENLGGGDYLTTCITT